MRGPRGPKHRHVREDQRRVEAEERQIRREKRTDLEQLAILNDRPGESARERSRLVASDG